VAEHSLQKAVAAAAHERLAAQGHETPPL